MRPGVLSGGSGVNPCAATILDRGESAAYGPPSKDADSRLLGSSAPPTREIAGQPTPTLEKAHTPVFFLALWP